jgi:uncharacterized protein YllA (UPF0747 family)
MDKATQEERLSLLEKNNELHAEQISLLLQRNKQHDEWMSTLDHRVTIMHESYQENLNHMRTIQANSWAAIEAIRAYTANLDQRLDSMQSSLHYGGQRLDTLVNILGTSLPSSL